MAVIADEEGGGGVIFRFFFINRLLMTLDSLSLLILEK